MLSMKIETIEEKERRLNDGGRDRFDDPLTRVNAVINVADCLLRRTPSTLTGRSMFS
jgi:hypothetical protein